MFAFPMGSFAEAVALGGLKIPHGHGLLFTALLPGAYRDQIAPGECNNFDASIFEPKVFREQMYCIGEKSTCDTVWEFSAPPVIRCPDIVPPCLLGTPLLIANG